MMIWLSRQGVTILMTTEVPEVFGELKFSTHQISFVADNIILLRYAEIQSELRRLISVVKMRNSAHDSDLRRYDITSKGAVVGATFREYTGLLSGMPTLVAVMGPQPFAPGLDAVESAIVNALFGLGTATAESLSAETGIARAEMERMLSKLVGGGFVVREQVGADTTFHVAMVAWSPGVRRVRPPRSGGGEGGGESGR
jgi:circadian clock protein KaiC